MSGKSASNMDVKRINKINIYREILKNERISQKELADRTNISWPTVLQNVGELREMGLIQDVGAFQSTGGRKAKAIAPIRDAKFSIGADITSNHISLVLVDLAGSIRASIRTRISFENTASYYENLAGLISDFLSENKVTDDKILGIGISFPGITDDDSGKIASSHVLGIPNMSYSRVSRHLPYPALFVNDANAAGFAEMRDLKGHSGIYLSLSNSVGGAVFVDGKLYEGEHHRGGEFGHMTLFPGGQLCYCGKKGCVDAYCASLRLSDHTGGDLDAFFQKVARKDPEILSVWEEYLTNLAYAVNNLRMSFDCDIILGGYVGAHFDQFLDQLAEKLEELNTFEIDGSYLKPCRYKLEASALGAALQWTEHFILTL